jgi:hypothetical protein
MICSKELTAMRHGQAPKASLYVVVRIAFDTNGQPEPAGGKSG